MQTRPQKSRNLTRRPAKPARWRGRVELAAQRVLWLFGTATTADVFDYASNLAPVDAAGATPQSLQPRFAAGAGSIGAKRVGRASARGRPIELNGDDMRRDPLKVRKATLRSMPAKADLGLRFNEHMEGDGPTVFAHACKMGLEGIVSKRKDSPYRSGRSPDWLKMKNPTAPAVKREAEEDWS